MIYITNAFSLQMLSDAQATMDVAMATANEVKEAFTANFPGNVVAAIGHADTAAIAAQQLDEADCGVTFTTDMLYKRISVEVRPGDTLYVLQVIGGRLPEGCTELPAGIQLQWRKVTVR